jgi:hypothetical protein
MYYCRAESDEVKKNVPTSEVDCGMFAVDTVGVRALLLAKVQYFKALLAHITCRESSYSRLESYMPVIALAHIWQMHGCIAAAAATAVGVNASVTGADVAACAYVNIVMLLCLSTDWWHINSTTDTPQGPL